LRKTAGAALPRPCHHRVTECEAVGVNPPGTLSGCRGLGRAGRGAGAARRGPRADLFPGREIEPPPGRERRSGKTPPQRRRWRVAENGRWADSWRGLEADSNFILPARTLRPSISEAQAPFPCCRDDDAQAEGPAKPLGLIGTNRQPRQVKPRSRRSPESTSPESTSPNSTTPNSTTPNSTTPNSTIILKLQRHF
jgi:hypothetical protein